MPSPHRRAGILDALRRGTVPRDGLAAFAVGMERFEAALDAELDAVAFGRGTFKAVRGEYGSGKTFFARWLQERARLRGFATSEVQVSETETPADSGERDQPFRSKVITDSGDRDQLDPPGGGPG